MKADKYLLAAAVFLLVWSMRSEAHGSHDALMEGGNLLQLTRAVLHPLLEIPNLPAFLICVLMLGLVLGPVILHMLSQNAINQERPPLKKGD
jgi:hypothetical protein